MKIIPNRNNRNEIEKIQKKRIFQQNEDEIEKIVCIQQYHVCNNHTIKGLKTLNDEKIWESNSQFLNEITNEKISPQELSLIWFNVLKSSSFTSHSF